MICLLFSYHSSIAQLDEIKSYYKQLEKQAKEAPITIQFVQAEMNLVKDLSTIDQIILLRHGEPALDKKGWRKRKETIRYVEQYDSVGEYPPKHIPVQLIDGEIDMIYTSTLSRSISTAEQLFPQIENQNAQPIFREFERKIFSFFNIKLPLKWWTTGSRLFWVMGLNKKGIESFSEAKERAKNANTLLESTASENGKVLLVSHGLLNHYLVKYCKDRIAATDQKVLVKKN